MTLDSCLYWTGAVFLITVCSAIVLFLIYCLIQVIFSIFREIWVWIVYDDFATWWSYKQFKKQYRYLNEECPHCGGTGLKDDDEGAKRALERLKNFCRAPREEDYKTHRKTKGKIKMTKWERRIAWVWIAFFVWVVWMVRRGAAA